MSFRFTKAMLLINAGKNMFKPKNKKDQNKLQLEKIGKVKMTIDRELPIGKLMSITVTKNPSGQYFASILIETEINHKPKTNKEVGIDLGIKTFSTQSDGIEINNPKFLNKNQVKLCGLQQHFSRKMKGSNRRNKCRLKIAKLHQKITNQRDWFLHNYSTQLINNYDKIYIEDLNVAGMSSRCRPKQDEKGNYLPNGQSAKSGLNKSINDASWSKFTSMLIYKADWFGKDVVKVNRFYASSKTCECGVKNTNLKLSDREWTCQSCGLVNQRDLLAANNILKEGRRSLGDITDAETEVTKSVKRLKLNVIN